MKNQRSKYFETPDALRHDAQTLVENAEALLEATKETMDEKVKVAREQLSDTIERGRDAYTSLQKRALRSARMADHTIHEHPYQTALVALGVGAMLGVVLARRP